MNQNFITTGTWILRLLAAVIMLQTLYFKFSGAEESIYIFTAIHLEPWGRTGIGVMELITAVLILYPATTAIGALLGIELMAGAICFHITKLGIVVQNEGGQLFIYSLLVFLSCLTLAILQRKTLQNNFNRVFKAKLTGS